MNALEPIHVRETGGLLFPYSARKRFQGLSHAVHFNWPKYAAAAATVALLLWLGLGMPMSRAFQVFVWLAILLALFWIAASLVAAHWVYDRSGIYEWHWIKPLLPQAPRHWANLHAGFDESTLGLQQLFPRSRGEAWDFHDVKAVTERSIHRARQAVTGAPPAIKVNYRSLPTPDAALDAAFVIFAAHELRHRSAREQFFAEVFRILRPGGNLVLVEHLRDGANWLAFGPGALHFFARREWLRLCNAAGLTREAEFSMTPFVRVFLFQRPL